MNSRSIEHQYFSKNGFDESLDDILSFVTSPDFCKTPWSCVTISVGKNRRGKKRGIVHVHRTSFQETNNFQIKFHRCKKKICDHDVCQKPCLSEPNIRDDLVPYRRKKRNKKRTKSSSSINLMSGNNEMCVSFADSIQHSSSFQRKRRSSQNGRRISGERKRERSKSVDCLKPSCVLYVYADGCKRKVSFQLHPDMEMFLVRALDKIEDYVGHRTSKRRPSKEAWSDDFSQDSELNISKKVEYPSSKGEDASKTKESKQGMSKSSVASSESMKLENSKISKGSKHERKPSESSSDEGTPIPAPRTLAKSQEDVQAPKPPVIVDLSDSSSENDSNSETTTAKIVTKSKGKEKSSGSLKGPQRDSGVAKRARKVDDSGTSIRRSRSPSYYRSRTTVSSSRTSGQYGRSPSPPRNQACTNRTCQTESKPFKYKEPKRVQKCLCKKGDNSGIRMNQGYRKEAGVSYSTDSSDNVERYSGHFGRSPPKEPRRKCRCACEKGTCPKLAGKRRTPSPEEGYSPQNVFYERKQYSDMENQTSDVSARTHNRPPVQRYQQEQQTIVTKNTRSSGNVSQDPRKNSPEESGPTMRHTKPSATIHYYPCSCCGCKKLEPKVLTIGKSEGETEYRIVTSEAPHVGQNTNSQPNDEVSPKGDNSELVTTKITQTNTQNRLQYDERAHESSDNTETSPEISHKVFSALRGDTNEIRHRYNTAAYNETTTVVNPPTNHRGNGGRNQQQNTAGKTNYRQQHHDNINRHSSTGSRKSETDEAFYGNRPRMVSHSSGTDDLMDEIRDANFRSRPHDLTDNKRLPMVSRGSDSEDFINENRVVMSSQKSGTDDLVCSDHYTVSNIKSTPCIFESNLHSVNHYGNDDYIYIEQGTEISRKSVVQEFANDYVPIMRYGRSEPIANSHGSPRMKSNEAQTVSEDKFFQDQELRFVNVPAPNFREIDCQKCIPALSRQTVSKKSCQGGTFSDSKDPVYYVVPCPKTEPSVRKVSNGEGTRDDGGHLHQTEQKAEPVSCQTQSSYCCKMQGGEFQQGLPNHEVTRNTLNSCPMNEGNRFFKNCYYTGSQRNAEKRMEDRRGFIPMADMCDQHTHLRRRHTNVGRKCEQNENHHRTNIERINSTEEEVSRKPKTQKFPKNRDQPWTDERSGCVIQQSKSISQGSKFDGRSHNAEVQKSTADRSNLIVSDDLKSPNDRTKSTDVIHALCRGTKKHKLEKRHQAEVVSIPNRNSSNVNIRQNGNQKDLKHPSGNCHTIYCSSVQGNPRSFEITIPCKSTHVQNERRLKGNEFRENELRHGHTERRSEERTKACCIPPVNFCVENLRECSDVFQTHSRCNSTKSDERDVKPFFDTPYVGFIQHELKSPFLVKGTLEPGDRRASRKEGNNSYQSEHSPSQADIESDSHKDQETYLEYQTDQIEFTPNIHNNNTNYRQRKSEIKDEVINENTRQDRMNYEEQTSKERFSNGKSKNEFVSKTGYENHKHSDEEGYETFSFSKKNKPDLKQTFFKGWYLSDNVPPYNGHYFCNTTNKTNHKENNYTILKENTTTETQIDITLALNSSKEPTQSYNILEDESISFIDNKTGKACSDKEQPTRRRTRALSKRRKFRQKKCFKNKMRTRVNAKEEGSAPPEILGSSLESLFSSDKEPPGTQDSESSDASSGVRKTLALGDNSQSFQVYRSEVAFQNCLPNRGTSKCQIKKIGTRRKDPSMEDKTNKKESMMSHKPFRSDHNLGKKSSSETERSISKFNTTAQDPVEFQETLLMKAHFPQHLTINVRSFQRKDQQVFSAPREQSEMQKKKTRGSGP